jgi:hypothetical protein
MLNVTPKKFDALRSSTLLDVSLARGWNENLGSNPVKRPVHGTASRRVVERGYDYTTTISTDAKNEKR